MAAGHEPPVCPGSTESQAAPGPQPEQRGQQGREVLLPLCCALGHLAWSTASTAGVLRAGEIGAVGARPEEGHRNGGRDGSPPCEDRLRAGAVQHGEEKAREGELRAACQHLKGL